jgi:hypothetical protein
VQSPVALVTPRTRNRERMAQLKAERTRQHGTVYRATRTCGRSLRAHGRWRALPAGGCSRPQNVGLRQLVVTRCSANQDLSPNDVLLCSTCRTFIGARPPSVPPLCVANELAVSEVPECIAVLNPMELRLVTQVRGLTCYLCSRNLLPPLLLLPLAAAASCCCLLLPLLQVLNTGLPHPHPHPTHTLTLQTCRVPAEVHTLIVLPRGQTGGRGLSISLPFDVGHLVTAAAAATW